MKEVIFIILQNFFFFLFFYISPFNLILENAKTKFSFIDQINLNIIFFLNILLISSFIKINNFYFIIFYIILCLISLLIKIYYKWEIKKIDLSLVFITLILSTIFSIDLATSIELSWDAKWFWFLKTSALYAENNIYLLKDFISPDYPHLGSLAWSLFWKYPFNLNEYFGRIFYIFFFITSILSFVEVIKVEYLKKIFISLLFIFLIYEKSIFSGNQEILVFSIFVITLKIFLIFMEKKKIYSYFFINLFIFSIFPLAWIKNEGFFLTAIIIFSLILIFYQFSNFSNYLILITFLIFFSRQMFLFIQNINLESFEFDKTLKSSNFENILNNSFFIFKDLIIYSLLQPLIIFGVISMLYIILFHKFFLKKEKLLNFIFIFFILKMVFIFFAFHFSMENVEWQSKVGMKRVLFQFSPIYLLVFYYLDKIKIFK